MIEDIPDLVNFKTATEIIKNLFSLVKLAPSKGVPGDFADSVNTEIRKLHRELLSAHEDQVALVELVSELKDKLAKHETWEIERARYRLKELEHGGFAYSLNDAERSGEPDHHICAKCYEDQVKSILQPKKKGFVCPRCNNTTPGHNFTSAPSGPVRRGSRWGFP